MPIQRPPQPTDLSSRPGRHDPRHALGRLGESVAAAHLLRLGFSVVARNARTRRGEIDLIAYDGHTLVFVEVKTRRATTGARRSSPTAHNALEGLRPRQQARLRRLAGAWLAEQRPTHLRAREIRFDAVGVILDSDDKLLSLEHLEAAW